MANVFDVAEYILRKCGAMSAMKLQKLVYYSQAWSLVWDDEPIFQETIEAWINGPVVPALYQKHKGVFKIFPNSLGGNPDMLTPEQKDTVDLSLCSYSRCALLLLSISNRKFQYKDSCYLALGLFKRVFPWKL